MVIGSASGAELGLGDPDGIDNATARKKSNMYWRDAGSYCEGYVTSPI
jgi:hypothetical protein